MAQVTKEKIKEYNKRYYEKHKKQIKKNTLENRENLNKYSRKYYQDNKIEINKRDRKQYREKKEEVKKRVKEYYRLHKNEIKKRYQEYYEEHEEEIKEYKKEYRCSEKGIAAAQRGQKKFRHAPKGKMSNARCHAIRRRQFSAPQIFLNDFKFNSEAHHIDYHHMVYIPRSIHRMFHHDINKSSKNLDIVNSVAYAEVYFYNKSKQEEIK